MAENQRKGGRRLLLFPTPLQGHINPMLQLANTLYSRGFSITIIHTLYNSPSSSNYPHFTFRPIPDGLTESEVSAGDVIALLSRLNVTCAVPFRDCLARLLSEEEPVACLITDALWHFSQSVTDGLELPRIVLRTSSISSFLAYTALQPLRAKGYYLPKLQESELEAPLPEHAPLKFKDLPIISTRDPDVFFNLVADMIKATKASSGVIWNSLEELEQSSLLKFRQAFPVPNFLIGPFHKYSPAYASSLIAQDRTSLTWLDKQAPKSVLYVSFGSIAAMDEKEFLEMAFGLARSHQPFLWVIRPGLVRGSKWLEVLPSGFMEGIGGNRGYIVKWAPQLEVLAHPAVRGFWTHNGWNSTLESICEGVPMICSPHFGDQKVNASYVTDVWRIGMRFENGMEKGMVEETIRRLMVEGEGEEMRERILCLKEKADHCQKEGGSSHNYLESLVGHILSLRSRSSSSTR